VAVSPRVTVLFDNRPGVAGLRTLWGFAALVEAGGRMILFDTGSNGRLLLRNMHALGVSPQAVDLVFLSHTHWDHIGGLDSVLEENPDVTVVVHEGFSRFLVGDLRSLCREVVVVGAPAREFAPGVFSTGMFGSEPAEHALVLATGDVAAVVTGCAHPGIERIVERGVSVVGGPVRWAIGGFHLLHADADEIDCTIRELAALGVTDVLPTHCTGDLARAAFERAYGERCSAGGVGRTIDLGARPLA